MKKIILFVIISLITTVTYAQGIQFFHGTYEEAKAKAQKENKNIFVDVYTSWCGPCKQMATKVFTQKEVGDYYNKNFVCLKLDAEKEANHGFFKEYKATSYPSYFWVDSKGVLLDRQGGSCSPEAFIAMGDKAVKSNFGNNFAKLEKQWKAGNRSMEMVREYVLTLLPMMNPNAVRPTMIEYINGLPKEALKSYTTYNFIKGFCQPRDGKFVNDELTKVFFENLSEYEKYSSKYDNSLQSLHKSLYRTFVRSNTGVLLRCKNDDDIKKAIKEINKSKEYIKSFNLEHKDLYLECIDAEILLYTGKYSKGVDKVEKIVEKYNEYMPTLKGNLFYTIAMSKYLLAEKKPNIDKVVKLASQYLKEMPSKESVVYYAAAQKAAGNADEAYSAMAWSGFYDSIAVVSNAVYKYMNISNLRAKFPASNPVMDEDIAKTKSLIKSTLPKR